MGVDIQQASMGPSMIVDGKAERRAVTSLCDLASMGPSMIVDGKLQGIASGMAPGAGASMGPSMIVDGKCSITWQT